MPKSLPYSVGGETPTLRNPYPCSKIWVFAREKGRGDSEIWFDQIYYDPRPDPVGSLIGSTGVYQDNCAGTYAFTYRDLEQAGLVCALNKLKQALADGSLS